MFHCYSQSFNSSYTTCTTRFPIMQLMLNLFLGNELPKIQNCSRFDDLKFPLFLLTIGNPACKNVILLLSITTPFCLCKMSHLCEKIIFGFNHLKLDIVID